MHLPSTCNINKHFMLQSSVVYSFLLFMKSSRTVHNSASVALAIPQDIYKKDHVPTAVEKTGASLKTKPKWKLCQRITLEENLSKHIYYNANITYSSSYNLTPSISLVLIRPQLFFCSLTPPTCCNSSRKCNPVKYKARQKTGFPIVT